MRIHKDERSRVPPDPKCQYRMGMVIVSAVAAVIALSLFFLCIVFSGFYSVAASKPDSPVIRWLLRTTMERSVRFHARQVEAPNVFEQGRIETGFRHYDEMCVICHGAPGVRPDILASGLNPKPPDLAKAAERWTPAETYWIIRHGVRMTGMAAFEGSHDDIELWAIAAFVKRLPKVTTAEYAAMQRREKKPGEAVEEVHRHQ